MATDFRMIEGEKYVRFLEYPSLQLAKNAVSSLPKPLQKGLRIRRMNKHTYIVYRKVGRI